MQVKNVLEREVELNVTKAYLDCVNNVQDENTNSINNMINSEDIIGTSMKD